VAMPAAGDEPAVDLRALGVARGRTGAPCETAERSISAGNQSPCTRARIHSIESTACASVTPVVVSLTEASEAKNLRTLMGEAQLLRTLGYVDLGRSDAPAGTSCADEPATHEARPHYAAGQDPPS
jgi:hypothetical protein